MLIIQKHFSKMLYNGKVLALLYKKAKNEKILDPLSV